ncbi:ERV/ALR sulfhydryl oxidase domain-containing protein [Mycotypha africana]|uniref:ERV/ALR sulfhydryl oxidase domain-containing protein n=1 Tax=Mycotypha africana TaxID=64632 RepID=UPI002301F45B|nr:ERV/ALR sulfhydryl oxidase domain-containing protein [Mycotypha africana]KAI8970129.1 ERV/ALR sulfhydryl oxidase domain-containing protein [Mycotypha africana]
MSYPNDNVEVKNNDTWRSDNCPADAVTLGRAAWVMLHTTAAYYPDRPAPSQMDSMRAFMKSFFENYPCLGEDLKREMEEEPIRVGSRRKLSDWLCRQHNKVNAKLGKPMFDCSKVFDRWLQGYSQICDE